MTDGSLDDKKLDDLGTIFDDRGLMLNDRGLMLNDRGIILDDQDLMLNDRQHDLRMRRSEKGPPVASVSVLRIVAISGKISFIFIFILLF